MEEFVLSISYGNYLIQNGGTDKVIREHCKMFNRAKLRYLFIFPIQQKKRVGGEIISLHFWGLNLDQHFVGVFTFNNLIKVINNYQIDNECRAIFIHHTWRVEEYEIKKLLRLNKSSVYFYLHDFHMICDNNNFMDKVDHFCGYGVSTFKCNDKCENYNASCQNRILFKHIMEEYKDRICCIAPSENTKHIFANTFPTYEKNFKCIEHQKVTYYRGLVSKEGKPLRVAFIGAQNSIKGWDDFKLIINNLEKEDIELYYLGTGTDIPSGVKAVRVSVREQGDSAMQDALLANKIDVVLLLSCWPETYSYTFFESLSAGCFVIAYECSGNIVNQIKQKKCGKIFKSFQELNHYLGNVGRLKKDVYEYRNSGSQIPGQLVPNDEIVKMVDTSLSKRKSIHETIYFNHRSYMAELVYRLRNRRKFNGSKK